MKNIKSYLDFISENKKFDKDKNSKLIEIDEETKENEDSDENEEKED